MFTQEELKEMLRGVDLMIKKAKETYYEKVDLAEKRGWDISRAAQNSIDYASDKISQLEQLRAKIREEINHPRRG